MKPDDAREGRVPRRTPSRRTTTSSRWCASTAGSISAEHGIGLLKKDYLSYSRTPAELALLRTLKRALDPNSILNPGKILDT